MSEKLSVSTRVNRAFTHVSMRYPLTTVISGIMLGLLFLFGGATLTGLAVRSLFPAFLPSSSGTEMGAIILICMTVAGTAGSFFVRMALEFLEEFRR